MPAVFDARGLAAGTSEGGLSMSVTVENPCRMFRNRLKRSFRDRPEERDALQVEASSAAA